MFLGWKALERGGQRALWARVATRLANLVEEPRHVLIDPSAGLHLPGSRQGGESNVGLPGVHGDLGHSHAHG